MGAYSFDETTLNAPPMRESTRNRETFFSDFAEQPQKLNSPVSVQLTGSFRSRTGIGDVVASSVYDLVGLGSAAVIEPSLAKDILLNPGLLGHIATTLPRIARDQRVTRWIRVKVVGRGLAIQFFY
jgi:2,4-dienoyl-CoA reductase-like NADH-dependent reductase (Old Yellow Enzyme family)